MEVISMERYKLVPLNSQPKQKFVEETKIPKPEFKDYMIKLIAKKK